MHNLIPTNINLISGEWKLFSPFFSPKVTFTSNENLFFNESFIPASVNSFCKQYSFAQSLFSAVGNHD